MEPQLAVKNLSTRHPSAKTKTKSKKSRYEKIIERTLSVDDSFNRLHEDTTDDVSSKDLIQDQTRLTDATCDSCPSHSNFDLGDATSSLISGCSSSFAFDSRRGNKPKRVSILKKKRYQKIISQALSGSFGLDIPEVSETADPKSEITVQKQAENPTRLEENESAVPDLGPTGGPMKRMVDVPHPWQNSMLKVRSGIEMMAVSDDIDSAVHSKEIGKKNAVLGLKGDAANKAAMKMAEKSSNYGRLAVEHVSKIDIASSSLDGSFADASVQTNLCNCPVVLIRFPSSTNINTSTQQNLSRSESNRENSVPGNKFSTLENPLGKVGDRSRIVPTSTDEVRGMTKAKIPKDGDGVEAKNDTEYASKDDLSHMFSRIGLSQHCSETHPNNSLATPLEVNTSPDQTESGALEEDCISPERLDFSLQVSFTSDGISDKSLGGEHRKDEMFTTGSNDDVENLLSDSEAAVGSNETILYMTYNASATTEEESLFADNAETDESVDRAPARHTRTKAERQIVDKSGYDLESEDDKPSISDSTVDYSSTHDPKMDFKNISLQVSISDESDATDHLESVRSERSEKSPERDGDMLAINDDDGLDNDDVITSLRDNDLIVSKSSLSSSAAVLSPSLATKDSEEQMEQARSERQKLGSIDSSSECSLAHSVRDVSLQVSLSSGDSSTTPADDTKRTKDHDRKDLDRDHRDLDHDHKDPNHDHKDLDHDQRNRDWLPPVPPRNPNCSKYLFDLSDEDPDECDPVDHHPLEVPSSKSLCSTFLGPPSVERALGADAKWVMSPIATGSTSRRRSGSVRMALLLASKNEVRSSGSYASANGSALLVPDTSEEESSDGDRGALYKTAFGECGVDGGVFVADSPESQGDASGEKEERKSQVVSVLDSESSDDEAFENFLQRFNSTEKISKFSPPSLDGFVVDDSEVDEEEKQESDDDVIIDDDVDDDDQVFYYQVDNERERCDVDALSNRLEKALDFSLTSDSSDDDFQKVKPKRKVVPKKTDKDNEKSTVADKDGASIFRTPAPPKDGGVFRTPAPVVPNRRILSVLTPNVSSGSVFSDNARMPLLGHAYTVGHAPAQRLSFLKSLSTEAKEFLRDPKAARFVKNFKSLRKELTSELFALFNQEVFDSKIPSDMNVIWNERLRRTAGFCRSRLTRDDPPKRLAQIELSVKVCDSADRLRDTLIHEMCHAVVWLEHGSREVHGPIWKFWAMKANRALPDLPLITRCHSYDISTKFIYKCTKCGYEIGRHSKSLDTDKKICGHCRGQFELLVRPRPGSQLDSAPSTPRTPNKFALFVKENYGDIKKTQPGIKHKDIMATIGARYSAKKAMLGVAD